MSREAELVIQKFRLMDAELKFLEFVWNKLSDLEKIRVINEYSGYVPAKYK